MRRWICLSAFVVSFNLCAEDWWPQSSKNLETISHSTISIGYDEDHEVPQWVGYILRREHLQDCFDRTNNFRLDPSVSTGSALPEDYRGSGYDRGHIAPAGDMKFSDIAMKESFLMSNITPQSPTMNRGRWATLETLIRSWAKEGSETFIVSGPVLREGLKRIGQTGVSVPDDHYKVILRNIRGKLSAIGFLMSQNPTHPKLEAYALSVDQIEDVTGLDFLSHLSEAEQDRLEKKINWQDWDFSARFSYDPCSARQR